MGQFGVSLLKGSRARWLALICVALVVGYAFLGESEKVDDEPFDEAKARAAAHLVRLDKMQSACFNHWQELLDSDASAEQVASTVPQVYAERIESAVVRRKRFGPRLPNSMETVTDAKLLKSGNLSVWRVAQLKSGDLVQETITCSEWDGKWQVVDYQIQ